MYVLLKFRRKQMIRGKGVSIGIGFGNTIILKNQEKQIEKKIVQDSKGEIDKVKKIYILGDGANWIRTGLEWLHGSINVLDKIHLMKAVNGIVGKESKENRKEKAENKKRIYRSFYALDFKQTKEIVYEILAEEMEETTRKRKKNCYNIF